MDQAAEELTYSPLAWELARYGVISMSEEGDRVRARLELSSGTFVSGFGRTSAEAIRSLALEIESWNEESRGDPS